MLCKGLVAECVVQAVDIHFTSTVCLFIDCHHLTKQCILILLLGAIVCLKQVKIIRILHT